MKLVTLNFLIDDNKILLAMKKRGFGIGKLNGVGGKVAEGETIFQAIIRETEEEIGVKINEKDLEEVGIIDFSFEGKEDWTQRCYVFITKKWQEEPIETEEMKPEWFNFENIPYNKMWIDDKYWLPLVLTDKKLEARFHFNNDGSEIKEYSVKEK